MSDGPTPPDDARVDGNEPADADSAALATIEERIGHSFADLDLLARALNHRSWCAEHPGTRSNERLEFLGDAVLGLAISEQVFTRWPDRDEGWLTRARSTLVRAATLAAVATELELGAAVSLGKGEEATGGRSKPSILADCLEAVIGAVHVDGGWHRAREVVVGLFADRLADLDVDDPAADDKSRLQEWVARELRNTVRYQVTEQGPEHDKLFTAQAVLDGRCWGTGGGRSKKLAEQAAARSALDALMAVPRADLPLPPDPPAGEIPTPTDETADA